MRYFFIGILTIGAVMALGLATSWFGLITARPMGQYAEDTRRLTFEHSRARQSGVNGAISDYCLNLRTATDPSQRQAMARWIVNEAATYEGPLSRDATDCVSEARSAL
jgi:hypothetical protein